MVSRDYRYDCEGPIRVVAEAEGYVMVRRKQPGPVKSEPFVLTNAAWNDLPREPLTNG